MSESPKAAAHRLAAPAFADGYKAEALHVYTDASGHPLYWRIRAKHPHTGEKWIRPMHMNGAGYALGEPRFSAGKPLYGLDRLAARPEDEVFLVEGEWCADHLAKLGLLATTPGAADSVAGADLTPLKGRTVVIWPDNDDAGRRFASEAGARLLSLGCATRQIDVDSLVLPLKGDAVDWLNAHPDAGANDVETLPFVVATPESSAVEVDAARDVEFDVVINDDELARQFARVQPLMRYVAAWDQWLLYDGQRWVPDKILAHYTLVRDFIRRIAAKLKDNDAKSLRGARTINAVATLARSNEEFRATDSQWDRDPWLLNTPDGVVDLRSGETRPHDPLEYHSRITPTGISENRPQWLAFLRTVTNGDEILIDYLQRACGYMATGLTREHVLFFLYGLGRNGKSTFVNMLRYTLGDYATTAPMDTFTESRVDRHPTEIAMLDGPRLVCAQETEEGRHWAEARIKQLTGGDAVSARRMRQDFYQFIPGFKLMVAGNHKPRLRNVDEAIRRRLHLIPFTVTIPAEDVDRDLGEKLQLEAPGILGWIVEGSEWYAREGLDPPEVVVAATEEYLTEQDQMGEWLDECCVVDADGWALSACLYDSYSEYKKSTGEATLGKTRFLNKLAECGFPRDRARGGKRIHRGLSVR